MLVICRAVWCFEMMFSKPSSLGILPAFGKACAPAVPPWWRAAQGPLRGSLCSALLLLKAVGQNAWGARAWAQAEGVLYWFPGSI